MQDLYLYGNFCVPWETFWQSFNSQLLLEIPYKVESFRVLPRHDQWFASYMGGGSYLVGGSRICPPPTNRSAFSGMPHQRADNFEIQIGKVFQFSCRLTSIAIAQICDKHSYALTNTLPSDIILIVLLLSERRMLNESYLPTFLHIFRFFCI